MLSLLEIAKNTPHNVKLEEDNIHFLDIYEKYFNELRFKKIKLLEIGVKFGGSIAVWGKYFENGEIYGIDIVDKRTVFYGNFFIGSQNDSKFLLNLAKEHGPFDIVIDDGSHKDTDQKASFKVLFKFCDLYVIEDIHYAYRKKYGNILKYIYELINEMHINNQIEWIHVYNSIVFIKRNKNV